MQFEPRRIHQSVIVGLFQSKRSVLGTRLLRMRETASKSRGHLANRQTFNRLIYRWIRMSRSGEMDTMLSKSLSRMKLAYSVHRLMDEIGVAADVTTYNGLMWLCSLSTSQSSFSDCYRWYSMMQKRGVAPNNTTLRLLFNTSVEARHLRRAEAAFDTFKEIEDDERGANEAAERGTIGLETNRRIHPTDRIDLVATKFPQSVLVAWCRALLRTGNHARAARVMRTQAMSPKSLEAIATSRAADEERGDALYVAEEALHRAARVRSPSDSTVAVVVERLLKAGHDERARVLLERHPLRLGQDRPNEPRTSQVSSLKSLRALARFLASPAAAHSATPAKDAFEDLLRRAQRSNINKVDASSLNVIIEAATALDGIDGAVRCLEILGGEEDDNDARAGRRSLPMSETMLCRVLGSLHTHDELAHACERLLPHAVAYHGVVPSNMTKRALVDLAVRVVDGSDSFATPDGPNSGMTHDEATAIADMWWNDDDRNIAPASMSEHLCRKTIEAAVDLVEPLAMKARSRRERRGLAERGDAEHAGTVQEETDAIRAHFDGMLGMLSMILPEWNPIALIPRGKSG